MELSEFRRYNDNGDYDVLSTKEYNDLSEWEKSQIKTEITGFGYIIALLITLPFIIGLILTPATTLVPLAFCGICLYNGLKLFR